MTPTGDRHGPKSLGLEDLTWWLNRRTGHEPRTCWPHLPTPRTEGASRVEAGVYLCSPQGAGLRAHFTELSIDTI